MNLILFDTKREALLPLTYTRPCADLRIGILTIKEKWEKHFNSSASFLTAEFLSEKYGVRYGDTNLYINGRALPDMGLVESIKALEVGHALVRNGDLIALRSDEELDIDSVEAHENTIELSSSCTMVVAPYDVFSFNEQEISNDYKQLTAGRTSAELSSSNTLIGDDIFIEEGAKVEASVLNTSKGPIYISKDSEVMEGCLIRGPFATCEHAVVKMGAKIYGATTLGPYCKVGGEVNNVVFQGYSNKGHDGFLGNSAIGEWCNIGADTNSSNLKNNYAEVKLWSYETERFKPSGLQFCGLIMGDHSKCGINTMFNTGTVVGVCANIFGSGFPRNFVPSFSWGGSSGFTSYALKKCFETNERVMARRNQPLTEIDKNILKHIFENSSQYRIWERKD